MSEPERQEERKQNVEETPFLVNIGYSIETFLKLAFIFTALLQIGPVTWIGFVASLLGVLRNLKLPRLNQEYLRKLLMNQFGMNILYFTMLALQQAPRTYLFYAPITIHFFIGIVEYLNMRQKKLVEVMRLDDFVTTVRENRNMLLVFRGKLEFLYEMLLIFTIPFDISVLLPAVMLAQYMILKHKISVEFRYAMHDMNHAIYSVVRHIPGINFLYDKLVTALAKM